MLLCGMIYTQKAKSIYLKSESLSSETKFLGLVSSGRRVAACQPATMVPTKSPVQPVVVEGGWTEQAQEEIKLMELIRHTEVCSLGFWTLKMLPFLWVFKSTILNFKMILLIYSQHLISYDHISICQALSWHLKGSCLKDSQLIWGSVLFEWRPEIMTLAKKRKRPSGYVQR